MERREILTAIKSHIEKNNGVWGFCNDKGNPMGNISIGNLSLSVMDLALDGDNEPCFLVTLEIAETEELKEILNCM